MINWRRDMTGARVGQLTVLRLIEKRKSLVYWECQCDCGVIKEIAHTGLQRKVPVQSCGCLRKARFKYFPVKHGQSRIGKTTVPYRRWKAMLGRCYNPKNKAFHRYGGRGITVCKRWRNSFENFYADMGDPPPRMTLERKNNALGYSPGNCRWATMKEQCNNRRTNRVLTFQNKTMTMRQWEEELHFPKLRLQDRLRKGWSVERALSTPLYGYGGRRNYESRV